MGSAAGQLARPPAAGCETAYEITSPVTGAAIARVPLATREEIGRAVSRLAASREPISAEDAFAFLERLQDGLRVLRDELFEMTTIETGFISRDSGEIVDGAIEFLRDFQTHVQLQSPRQQLIRHSYSAGSQRDMRITNRPFRCVAALVPQNASLSLGITIIASALYAGCRVILRPSLQSGATAMILADLVAKSRPPRASVEIVNCLATDFLEACYASEAVDLIHYIGSNRHALPVFSRSFAAGKICLLDGQGNGMLYVDSTFPVEDAVRLVTSGATRYNGETCTSVNGVLVERSVYGPVKEALVASFRGLCVGDPFAPETHVGPLFSEKQAAELRATLDGAAGGRVLCGGDVRGAYFTPAVLEGVRLEDTVVREGFFGPAVWIAPIDEGALCDWLRANRFPLSDTVLSRRRDVVHSAATNSRAARICVNEDPSVESMFEPWGGYPPSGLNPVSVWTEKYRQTFQLDGRLSDILAM